jgi:hypothetical protein
MAVDLPVFAVVVAVLLAQSSPAMIEQPGESLTAEPTQAVHFGRIVGAATQCASIDAKRVRTDIIAFNFVLLAAAKTRSNFTIASQQFSAAIPEGAELLRAGSMNCADVSSELAALEKQASVTRGKTIRRK